jgi:hypothetical protein
MLLEHKSVVQVHRKYRKRLSALQAAAGISKISPVEELGEGGGVILDSVIDSPQYNDILKRKARRDQNVKRVERTFRRSARKPVV